jgi:two-component system NarL family response regulator
VIILTTYEEDENIYRALHAGARAYLLKDVPQDQLLGAIRMVHSGGYHLPPEIVARLAGRLPMPDLSAREVEILKGIVNGLSNKEIASMLSIAENTVKNHVNNILSKLQVHDRTAAATKALRQGIVTLK